MVKSLQKEMLHPANWSILSKTNKKSNDKKKSYLLECTNGSFQPVRVHCNIILWADTKEELAQNAQMTEGTIKAMGCHIKQAPSTFDNIFKASVPTYGGELNKKLTFLTSAQQATCLMNTETFLLESAYNVGHNTLRFTDKLSGRLLHFNMLDDSHNKLVIGPAGSGKSVLVSYMIYNYYQQGKHIMVIDEDGGHNKAYVTLTNLVGGQYVEIRKNNLPGFNPFEMDILYADQVNPNPKLHFETLEAIEKIIKLLMFIWEAADEHSKSQTLPVFENALITYYTKKTPQPGSFRSLNDFILFLQGYCSRNATDKQAEGYHEAGFELNSFLSAMEPFLQGGEFEGLLNTKNPADYVKEPFIVFSLHDIKREGKVYGLLTLLLLNQYNEKCKRLKSKQILVIEESWRSFGEAGLEYIIPIIKTSRLFSGEIIFVTYEVEKMNNYYQNFVNTFCQTKILLNVNFDYRYAANTYKVLDLSPLEIRLANSVNRRKNDSSKGREFFISFGTGRSYVLGLELSAEEYITYNANCLQQYAMSKYAKKPLDMASIIQLFASHYKRGELKSFLEGIAKSGTTS